MTEVECPRCEGKGEVTTFISPYNCPRCKGTGTVEKVPKYDD